MNSKRRSMPTRFGPDIRFEFRPLPAVPYRGTLETGLDRLKDRLLKAELNQTLPPELQVALRRAANEAAGLAWMTPFPLLVFPTLFEERARATRLQAVLQERIRRRSQPLMVEAA